MDNLEQISLFELEDGQGIVDFVEGSIETESSIVPYDVEDRVSIANNVDMELDPESYFYLKDFEGKRGVILKVIEKPSLQYEVAFGDKTAFVYHHELRIGWSQK